MGEGIGSPADVHVRAQPEQPGNFWSLHRRARRRVHNCGKRLHRSLGQRHHRAFARLPRAASPCRSTTKSTRRCARRPACTQREGTTALARVKFAGIGAAKRFPKTAPGKEVSRLSLSYGKGFSKGEAWVSSSGRWTTGRTRRKGAPCRCAEAECGKQRLAALSPRSATMARRGIVKPALPTNGPLRKVGGNESVGSPDMCPGVVRRAVL